MNYFLANNVVAWSTKTAGAAFGSVLLLAASKFCQNVASASWAQYCGSSLFLGCVALLGVPMYHGVSWLKVNASFIASESPCSFGLSATSQQYFSLRTNQQLASSIFLSEQISNQPAVLFSRNKSATSQQYFSLRTKTTATSQTNGLVWTAGFSLTAFVYGFVRTSFSDSA
jgi:hypothetical protein